MQEKKSTFRRSSKSSSRQLTERQRAARSRQIQESRSMSKEERRQKAGLHHDVTQRQMRTGGPRVTGLIVEELGKALATVLKLDGPADVLMSRFFRLNHKLGAETEALLLRRFFIRCVTSQPFPGK